MAMISPLTPALREWVRFLKRTLPTHEDWLLAILRRLPLPTPATARLPVAGRPVISLPRHSVRAWLQRLGIYEPDLTALVTASLRPGMTFVDVGACCGYYAIMAARLVGDTGRVVAFEPDPRSYRLLTANASRNGCANIVAVPRALSDSPGVATLLSHRDPELSYIARDARTMKGIEVAVSTLDIEMASLGWPPVHLVKVDVEGQEAAVLRGMVETAARNPHLLVVVEFDARNLERAGSSAADLADAIELLGLTDVRVIERDLQPLHAAELQGLSGCYSLLLRRTP